MVYIFPDRFKIARRTEPPFTPYATVRVYSDADGSDPRVVFDYLIASHLEAKRLVDARSVLQQPGFGASEIEFKPLPTSDVRFFIDRPSSSGSVHEQRTGVVLVVQGAIKDALTMPLSDFKLLFDAMHQARAALFISRVEIDVPGGAIQTISLDARFDDLEGEILSYEATATVDSLSVSLLNAPIDSQTLDLSASDGPKTVVGAIALSAIPRLNLRPGEIVDLKVTPLHLSRPASRWS